MHYSFYTISSPCNLFFFEISLLVRSNKLRYATGNRRAVNAS